MPQWQGSTRRDRLPPDWGKIRQRVGSRDRWLCQMKVDDGLCLMPATDVDHIQAGDNHELWNLRCLCTTHHKTKTGQEGAAAMHAKRRKIDKKFRRTDDHPGLL